jgi:hypothetical protein
LLPIEERGDHLTITAHDRMLDADRQMVRADELGDGDRVALCEHFPWSVMTTHLAELLGLLCADGWV